MDIKFSGKRALVTGGGRGIGREIAQRLAMCGAKTFVLTKSSSSVENLKQEDPDIVVKQVDVTDWDSTRKAVESILPIDLLVNNAGAICRTSFLESTQSDIDDVFNVNYKATFNVSQIIARDLITRKKSGAIVNISSALTMKHSPNRAIYGSSKAAVDSLTKYMALELGPKQIRVNAVNPTFVVTDFTRGLLADLEVKNRILSGIPLGRVGETRDVADAVLFLLSEYASLVNGVTMPIDGGQTL